MKRPEVGPDGLIPRSQVKYEDMNEKGIQAIRFLARSMIEFDRSTSWWVRTCKFLGFDWVDVLGFRLWLDGLKKRISRFC